MLRRGTSPVRLAPSVPPPGSADCGAAAGARQAGADGRDLARHLRGRDQPREPHRRGAGGARRSGGTRHGSCAPCTGSATPSSTPIRPWRGAPAGRPVGRRDGTITVRRAEAGSSRRGRGDQPSSDRRPSVTRVHGCVVVPPGALTYEHRDSQNARSATASRSTGSDVPSATSSPSGRGRRDVKTRARASTEACRPPSPPAATTDLASPRATEAADASSAPASVRA